MKRFFALALLLLLLWGLTACSGSAVPEEPPAPPVQDTPPQDPLPEEPPAPEGDIRTDGDDTLYTCGGVDIALPTEYLELLVVDTDFPDAEESWKPLLSVYEKASVEAAQAEFGDSMGFGFLFGFLSVDRAGYEQFLEEDGSGMEAFATDGTRYYIYTFPTDVQFYRPDSGGGSGMDTRSEAWKTWETLNELGLAVREDLLQRNGLTPLDPV